MEVVHRGDGRGVPGEAPAHGEITEPASVPSYCRRVRQSWPSCPPTPAARRPCSRSRRSSSQRPTRSAGSIRTRAQCCSTTGSPGQLRAVVNTASITEIRTAAVSAAATKTLASNRDRAPPPVLGSGVQGRAHVDAMQTVLEDPIIRMLEPQSRARRGSRARNALAGRDHDRGGARRRRCRLHGNRCRRADRRAALAGSRDAHQRGRVVFRTGRHVSSARRWSPRRRLYVDRRESTFTESGDYRARSQTGIEPDHVVGELGELLAGMCEGAAPGEELTLFESSGHRRRGSRRRGALREPRTRAGAGISALKVKP